LLLENIQDGQRKKISNYYNNLKLKLLHQVHQQTIKATVKQHKIKENPVKLKLNGPL